MDNNNWDKNWEELLEYCYQCWMTVTGMGYCESIGDFKILHVFVTNAIGNGYSSTVSLSFKIFWERIWSSPGIFCTQQTVGSIVSL